MGHIPPPFKGHIIGSPVLSPTMKRSCDAGHYSIAVVVEVASEALGGRQRNTVGTTALVPIRGFLANPPILPRHEAFASEAQGGDRRSMLYMATGASSLEPSASFTDQSMNLDPP